MSVPPLFFSSSLYNFIAIRCLLLEGFVTSASLLINSSFHSGDDPWWRTSGMAALDVLVNSGTVKSETQSGRPSAPSPSPTPTRPRGQSHFVGILTRSESLKRPSFTTAALHRQRRTEATYCPSVSTFYFFLFFFF